MTDRPPPRRPPLASTTIARLVAIVLLGVMIFGGIGLLGILDVSTGPGPVGAAGTPGPGTTEPPGQATAGPGLPTQVPGVVVPPADQSAPVSGSILFVRGGNVWSVTDRTFSQVTDGGADSWPIWSPGGDRIYVTRTATEVAVAPHEGGFEKITLEYPSIVSLARDGTDPQVILDSLYELNGPPDAKFFLQVVQPDVSPDGTRFALVSDAPDPFSTDVTLSLLPTDGGRVRNLGLEDEPGLGHNDPEWSPDGRRIAFTWNGRNGSVGRPRIAIYTVATGAVRLLGDRGFANPNWSPDGRLLAVERSDGKGRDLAILDATTGALVKRLTTARDSFAPAFSPDGSQIAYLRLAGQAVDLRLMTLAGDGSHEVVDDRAVTDDGTVDPASPISWAAP